MTTNDAGAAGTGSWTTALRRIAIVLGFALGLVSSIFGIIRAMDAAGIAPGIVRMNLGNTFRGHVEIAENFRPSLKPQTQFVVFSGDSTVVSFPVGYTVPEQLAKFVARRAPDRFQIWPVAAPGVGMFEYYALTDVLADLRPDVLVLPLNLQSLSLGWRDFFDRGELVAWITDHRVPEALALPLHWWGVSLDKFALYGALVRLGLGHRWFQYRNEQVRVGRSVKALRVYLQGGSLVASGGLPAPPSPLDAGTPRRFSATNARLFYGPALDGVDFDWPVVRALNASLKELDRLGIRVIAYVVPVNHEHFERVGVDDPAGRAQTMSVLRTVVERNGGAFLDLHDMLPDAGFRDAGGHFTYDEDGIHGSRMVGEAIGEALLRMSARERARR